MSIMFHAYCFVHISPNVRKKFIDEFIAPFSLHPTDLLIVTTSPTTIQDVKEVKSFLSRTPFASKLKAVVVLSDDITLPAQHAMLKTLEEPPPDSLIILAVGNIDIFIPTILSRCTIKIIRDQPVAKKSEELVNDSKSFWKSILSKSLGERLVQSSSLANDRKTLAFWLEEQIVSLRHEMLDSYNNKSSQLRPNILFSIIKTLIQTHQLVKANISLKLALDQLFISLPKT